MNNRSVDNMGGYMLVDVYSGFCLDGGQFELTLDSVEAYLAEKDKGQGVL